MFNNKWKRLILFVLLSINIIIYLTYLIIELNIDHVISQFAKTMEYTLLYHIAFYMTFLGSRTFLIPFSIIVAIIFLFLFRSLKQSFILTMMTLFTYMSNELIKFIIKRERPIIAEELHATGYSFPSGHAMISLVFYGLFIYYINKKVSSRGLSFILSTITVMLIISIGFSRVILNVHYLSDVINGFLFGLIWLEFILFTTHKFE